MKIRNVSIPIKIKPVSTRSTSLNPGSSFLFSFAIIIKKSKTGTIKRMAAEKGKSPKRPNSSGRTDRKTKSFFRSALVFCSPRKMGNVSLPTILSPCISRISKKAVRTNTIPMAQIKTEKVEVFRAPLAAITGNNEVATPHARTIRIGFDPGISPIRR